MESLERQLQTRLQRLRGLILRVECRAVKPECKAYLDDLRQDRKSTRLNSSHIQKSRMPSSA